MHADAAWASGQTSDGDKWGELNGERTNQALSLSTSTVIFVPRAKKPEKICVSIPDSYKSNHLKCDLKIFVFWWNWRKFRVFFFSLAVGRILSGDACPLGTRAGPLYHVPEDCVMTKGSEWVVYAVKTHSLFHNTFYSPWRLRGKYIQYLSKRPSGLALFDLPQQSLLTLLLHDTSHLTFHTSHTTGEREAS